MDLIIISTAYLDLNLGARSLSAHLRNQGYEVHLVSFPKRDGRFAPKALGQLIEMCQEARLVGFSLMTADYEDAASLTQALRPHLDVPIIWGGIHPTICPEESVEHADLVCMGEAEETIVELLRRLERSEPLVEIPGVFLKSNGEIHPPSVPAIPQNLDAFPPFDFDIEGKWTLEGDVLVPGTEERQRDSFQSTFWFSLRGEPLYVYTTLVTRGCPHRCTYCSNSLFLDIFKGKGKVLRRRSNEHVIAELKGVLKRYPYINFIFFYDDTFFAPISDEDMEAFCEAYRREIGLPFACLASPATVTERKLEALVASGLSDLQMGIESGSERVTREVYNRKFQTNERTLKIATLFNKHKDRFIPRYDFITDNPYETEEDLLDSIRFVAALPRPFKIHLFSLVFFPQTALYDKALAEGIIDLEDTGYSKRMSKLENLTDFRYYHLLLLIAGYLPRSIFRCLIWPPLFRFLNQQWGTRVMLGVLSVLRFANRLLHVARTKVRIEPRELDSAGIRLG